jgi:hypothetical protein
MGKLSSIDQMAGNVTSGITPSFVNQLQSSLLPARSNGDFTPTFVRATAAAHTDFEGIIRQVPAGAARFSGARYVRNLFARSDDPTAAGWTLSVATLTAGFSDPFGGTGAFRILSAAPWTLSQTPATAGKAYRQTWYIKSNTASSQTFRFITGGAVSADKTITTAWQRISDLATATGTQTGITRDASNNGIDALIYTPMTEDVTGQTNQNPSEYVPALATANADSGAIGVRYFPYLNGNTVASNVVTEAQGAAIDSTQAACAGGVTAGVVDARGPLGYFAEGIRTNLALQSQTLATTWAVSSGTDMNNVVEDQYVAPDGTTTADKLQPKATNSTHYLKQAFTFSATVYTFSFYLRYVNKQWAAVGFNDGTTTWMGSFDLLNGVVGAKTANTTTSIQATALTGVYRCIVTSTTNAAAAAGNLYLSVNNTDTASLESWNAAGTELLGAWQGQLEAAAFASSPIVTTTVAVQRNADVLTYASAGNISGTQGSAYAEFVSVAVGSANTTPISGTGGSCSILQAPTATAIRLSDGTTSKDYAVAAMSSNVVNKVASSWGNSVTNGYANGAQGTPAGQAFDGNMDFAGGSSLAIAAIGYGTTRFLRIYPKTLSASQLQAMTS